MHIQRIYTSGARSTLVLDESGFIDPTNQDRLNLAIDASQEEGVACVVLGNNLEHANDPFSTAQEFLAFVTNAVVQAHKLDLS